MKGRKLLFLFLALLFPVLIFLFLKIFGENEFEVPVYHQDGVVARAGCNASYAVPYRVADTVMTQLGANKSDSAYVLTFGGISSIAMKRIGAEFPTDPVQILPLAESEFLRNCVLLMEEDASVVLVDRRNRIRGYYRGDDRDEVDRLIVEMRIILKKY